MRTDPFPYLETFAEAAERGGFTAAARQLGLSQAAVSQRIQRLEKLLRTALFRREAGRTTLTEAGKRLHGHARRILDITAQAWADVTGATQPVRGELILAASSVPGEHILPRLLVAFRNQHATIEVRVAVSDTDAVLKAVDQGKAHLGLVGGQGGGAHLEFRRLLRDELVLVVPKGHPWWRKKQVSVEQLVAQPLIQREGGSGSRRCLERALERVGVSAATLNVVIELGSSEAIKEAVLQRLGVAVLSRRAVHKEMRAGQVKALAIHGLDLDRDIFVVRDRRRALPTSAQLFLDLVNPEPEKPSIWSGP
jgi:DNA-binding transcriptional LysR family regulator